MRRAHLRHRASTTFVAPRHSVSRRVHLMALVTAVGVTGPPPAAAQEHAAEAVAFLSGCWAGTMGSLDMREQWTEADGGVLLGTTRFFRSGELVDFEFGMISEIDGVLTLWPWPRGTRSEHGFPLVRTEPEVVFENLEHDFPVRIVYAFDGRDALAPRIEGRDGEARRWSLRRVDCPG